jgi:serine/threonine-protein kinase
LDYYPTFSPDGRWLAYASNQSGRFEVYVRPYPAREPVTQVSTGGGWQPAWARDGRTLYYSANGAIMAVDVAAGPDFRPGLVRRVIPWNDYGFTPVRRYDVFPDGSFVDAALDPAAPPPPRGVSELQVILNFSALVAERVGREK